MNIQNERIFDLYYLKPPILISDLGTKDSRHTVMRLTGPTGKKNSFTGIPSQKCHNSKA